jgi:PPOX class probable F420-dependent enzyme
MQVFARVDALAPLWNCCPMSTSDLLRLGNEKYILLTTFRKSGERVSTPVWAAIDQDRVLITTGANSGKVKRIRNNNSVEIVECDMRGQVVAGAVPLTVQATVRTDAAALARTRAVMRRKYGVQFWLIDFGSKFTKKAAQRAAIELQVN